MRNCLNTIGVHWLNRVRRSRFSFAMLHMSRRRISNRAFIVYEHLSRRRSLNNRINRNPEERPAIKIEARNRCARPRRPIRSAMRTITNKWIIHRDSHNFLLSNQSWIMMTKMIKKPSNKNINHSLSSCWIWCTHFTHEPHKYSNKPRRRPSIRPHRVFSGINVGVPFCKVSIRVSSQLISHCVAKCNRIFDRQ